MNETVDAIEAKSKEAYRTGFDSWISQATTAMILSDFPENEKLVPLLRAAFQAGHASGQCFILVEMMKSSMARR